MVVVESIVGHSNPSMTRHYMHVGELAAGQAVALPGQKSGGIMAKEQRGKTGKECCSHLYPCSQMLHPGLNL
jgi:hypothetical protein